MKFLLFCRPTSRFVRSNINRPPQLVCTGLNSLEMGKVQDLVNKWGTPGSSVKRSWGEDITHVVVKTEPDRLAQRTLKYLFGVAAGCWVITLQWVLDSLSTKKLLPEVSRSAFYVSYLSYQFTQMNVNNIYRVVLNGIYLTCFTTNKE